MTHDEDVFEFHYSLTLNPDMPFINRYITSGIDVYHLDISEIENYINLYKTIGASYGWSSRISWKTQDWLDFIFTENDNRSEPLAFLMKSLEGVNIGFLELHPKYSENHLYIKYLGILEEYRGEGYGRIAMNFIKQGALNIGLNTIKLDTRSSDSPQAIKFYETMGFTMEEFSVVKHAPYPSENLIRTNKKNELLGVSIELDKAHVVKGDAPETDEGEVVLTGENQE
ncbi:MAG: GNAT family N-acetyltransferase [Rickettsiaceae bacterium]|nr:GNAT family N-acetyltransferase [Rickettsiaceae bacterium]